MVLASTLECMQNAIMPNVTIRAMNPETHAVLTRRAAAAGQSLQQYLSAQLEAMASRPTIEEHRHVEAIDDLRALTIQRHRTIDLLPRAIELRHTVTVADGLYVALAEELGVPLFTADRRLARASGVRCRVHILG